MVLRGRGSAPAAALSGSLFLKPPALPEDTYLKLDHLTDAISQKLDFRGKPCNDLKAAILQKEARLKALWSRRLAYQMPNLPKYEEVFRAIRRTLRHANLP